ncbi:hypothetical protein [Chromobacterium vaccinii]|uniref:hypothetical protein n=1 Tax=Chromobacterium vaccinii TaxID=1108595 RepID=UPI001E3ADBA3|nr:hypothetical protein [Chromobacterium vaccinii]MCD4502057.1 hypothetical protein [Chromobacterium vaccinii]
MNFENVNIAYGDFNYIGYPVVSLPKEAAKIAICNLLKEVVFSARSKALRERLGGLDYFSVESAVKNFQSVQLQGEVPPVVLMWADLNEKSVFDSVNDISDACAMLRSNFSVAADIQNKGIESVRSADTVEEMVFAAESAESQLKDLKW